MRRLLFFLLCFSLPLFGEPESGELHVKVSDPRGYGLRSQVELTSAATGFHASRNTDDAGSLALEHIPFGVYRIEVKRNGFATLSRTVEVHSTIPKELAVRLAVSAARTTVEVNDNATLLDPDESTSVQRLGHTAIEDRTTGQPGRSVQDLVNEQPGWLYEGSAVLHPRGSEYQAQFIVDGIPLTENRSPGLGPQMDADDVDSMSVYTAGYPAEYGRKLGGVIEINTTRDAVPGLHGDFELSGGSFDTRDAFARLQYRWGANTVSASGEGGATDWYLNPPVLQNFTNTGTTGEFALHYERDLDANDRVGLSVRHEQARFLVPDELLQEAAGQRQDRGTGETVGTFSYQHIFTPNLLGDVRFMSRSVDADLSSNPLSTPIIATQVRGFDEQYAKATVAYHHGMNEWKTGMEADFATVDEQFAYQITDPSTFDPATAPAFSFRGSSPDREQAAFVQDTIHLGNWTASLGLRWDHYRLVVRDNAVSPRLGIARSIDSLGMVLHASYDRIFQTPAMENLLLASSAQIAALNSDVLRLPVKPSLGNYYELGASKQFANTLRADVNYFRRDVDNFADDDLLLNTSVSFPIAFRRASIYGAEAKLEVPHWKRLSGWASYSYLLGRAYLPVTGGLFLGSEAGDALRQNTGSVAVTQDQRNTLATRLQYEIIPRVWAALSTSYGSGLPFEFDGTSAEAVAQYGRTLVDHVDFARGRVRPNYAIDLSASAELRKHEKQSLRLQADVTNLTNHLNLIDFAGLFSGNAIEPPRSWHLRMSFAF
jgi:hypothetical protein